MDIYDHFEQLSSTLLNIGEEEINKAITLLHEAKETNKTVFILGNGGSAATASHFANDLTKIAKIKAYSLTDMTPTMMAYGNDEGWENMFKNMLKVLADPDDVIVAISCSGNSTNVVSAAIEKKNLIVITGNDEKINYLARLKSKAFINILHKDITIVEDAHLAVCHAIAKALRD